MGGWGGKTDPGRGNSIYKGPERSVLLSMPIVLIGGPPRVPKAINPTQGAGAEVGLEKPPS